MQDTIGFKHLGRIRVHGAIEAVTGLHIGGNEIGLAIGGADNTVVRNGLDGRPYIPGSSLKGKMRCMLDRVYNSANLNEEVAKQRIHLCQSASDYAHCPVCNLFGVTPEAVDNQNLPARLLVRDAMMSAASATALENSLYTDMPFTQVKTEVVIDRITSAATPRQMERVPAGARFDFEFVFNVYRENDFDYLPYVSEAMELVEHDYLGGQGSRGYGQVRFVDCELETRWFNGVDHSGHDHVAAFRQFIEARTS